MSFLWRSFTGGFVEVAISLPGDNKVQGLWPAAWTMSNLGRAGTSYPIVLSFPCFELRSKFELTSVNR